MRRFTAAALFLTLALPVVRADEKDDAAKKLDGSYEVVSVSVDGQPDAAKRGEVKGFVIKDGVISITVEKKKTPEEANFNLDPSKKPAEINLTPKGEMVTLQGIYETKETDAGLELTMAFPKAPVEAERPADFKGGKGLTVVKLLRKKEK